MTNIRESSSGRGFGRDDDADGCEEITVMHNGRQFNCEDRVTCTECPSIKDGRDGLAYIRWSAQGHFGLCIDAAGSLHILLAFVRSNALTIGLSSSSPNPARYSTASQPTTRSSRSTTSCSPPESRHSHSSRHRTWHPTAQTPFSGRLQSQLIGENNALRLSQGRGSWSEVTWDLHRC